LGLPLGVGHLFQGNAIDEPHGCAILGCPCEGFDLKAQQGSPGKMDRQMSGGSKDGTLRTPRKMATRLFLSTERGKEMCQLCKCGHKYSAHKVALQSEGEVQYPAYWDHREAIARKSTGDFSAPSAQVTGAADFTDLVPVDGHSLDLFQNLMDSTYSPVWTRDRKKHNPAMNKVPKGYTVVRAYRSENSRIWREYGVKRAQLLADVAEARYSQHDDVASTVAWVAHGGALADRLKPEINEWYVFHGSTAENAVKICKHDFRLQYAGKSTGTLYGHGIYFAESVTKSDEYCKPNADGEYTMILCRVVGGHSKYTDVLEPDPEDLVQSCIEGPYDCIIGDRRKTRGTYREFVFYDSENVYAEYIIVYRRNF